MKYTSYCIIPVKIQQLHVLGNLKFVRDKIMLVL